MAPFKPITLVAYRAKIIGIFDATASPASDRVGFSFGMLADACWRDTMLAGGIPATQQLAMELMAQGYSGILVPSFAPHAQADDRNLVLWVWDHEQPSLFERIDDQDVCRHLSGNDATIRLAIPKDRRYPRTGAVPAGAGVVSSITYLPLRG